MERSKISIDPIQVKLILNELVRLKIITVGMRTHAEIRVLRTLTSSDVSKESHLQGFNIDPLITPLNFDTFWSLYPKKIDKGEAKTAWNKLCSKKDKPEWLVIEQALLSQKKTERWQDKQYIPYPSKWINNSRWLDDPKEMKIVVITNNKPKEIFKDHARYRLREDGYYYGANGDRLLD